MSITLDSPYREALEHLRKLEGNLHVMHIHNDHSMFYCILFSSQFDGVRLKDLPKTKTYNGEINHGVIMLSIITEEEMQLEAAIKAHPILAKRARLGN